MVLDEAAVRQALITVFSDEVYKRAQELFWGTYAYRRQFDTLHEHPRFEYRPLGGLHYGFSSIMRCANNYEHTLDDRMRMTLTVAEQERLLVAVSQVHEVDITLFMRGLQSALRGESPTHKQICQTILHGIETYAANPEAGMGGDPW